MNKIWIVLKNEFINTVSRRSFLLTLILIPLVPAIFLGGISLFGGDQTMDQIGQVFQLSPDAPDSEGYVDLAGIITQLPDWLEDGQLKPFPNELAARDALDANEITGYYFIDENYLDHGEIKYILSDFNPLSSIETTSIIQPVIQFNLLGGDQDRFMLYQNPANIKTTSLAPPEEARDMSNPLVFFLPYGITMLFYILILTSSSLMLNNIAKEKENRVMEILMSSIKPTQLLTGKIFGLGLVGLLQLVVWLGSAMLMLRLGGGTLNIPPEFYFPPSLFLWGIAYFILGYLVFATIMAGVGALVPNVKEASQATFIIILPILIPLMLIGVIINQPDAALSVVLSLIPFTSPNTMMTRLAIGPVPAWQLIVSIILLVLTVVLIIRATAGMFRAQTLLTGKKFNFLVYLKVLVGKA